MTHNLIGLLSFTFHIHYTCIYIHCFVIVYSKSSLGLIPKFWSDTRIYVVFLECF